MQAVGLHVFAGGFTMGVKRVMPVQAQLEIHGLGKDTVEQQIQIPFIEANRWQDWPTMNADFAFGNPRCSCFSLLTKCRASTGPNSHITQDIHDLVRWSTANKIPVFALESVQQAFKSGRPLFDYLKKEYMKDYAVAHVLMTTASFGNAQNRRRYFFVGYHRDLTFNVEPPKLSEFVSLHDVLKPTWNCEYEEVDLRRDSYHGSCCHKLTKGADKYIPFLKPGWSMNSLARYMPEVLDEKRLEKWEMRVSNVPFGLFGPYRLRGNRHAPTVRTGAENWIHPIYDRTLTVRELSTMMGWPITPCGPSPVGQLGKGIVPDVGEWLALHVKKTLEGSWVDNFESSYCSTDGIWRGREFSSSPDEKVFNMTEYRKRGHNLV